MRPSRSTVSLAKSLEPVIVAPRSSIHLSYDPPPIVGSIEVSRWIGSRPQDVALTGEQSITAPRDPGVYVYSVFARWPQGDSTHVFRIEIAPTH